MVDLDVAKLFEEAPQFIQGGLHIDDFQFAVENAPLGYTLTKFEMASDGYHWIATYTSLKQLAKEGRLV
ncbi:MAG: hypothetical protein QXE57_05025 [Nitrososphaerales archaeon]